MSSSTSSAKLRKGDPAREQGHPRSCRPIIYEFYIFVDCGQRGDCVVCSVRIQMTVFFRMTASSQIHVHVHIGKTLLNVVLFETPQK